MRTPSDLFAPGTPGAALRDEIVRRFDPVDDIDRSVIGANVEAFLLIVALPDVRAQFERTFPIEPPSREAK